MSDTVMQITQYQEYLKQTDPFLKILRYIDDHYSEDITLDAVAEACQVSTSTIMQLFRKRKRITFHSYLTQRRLEAATNLFVHGTPFKEASRQAGYSDYSSFYRAFKKAYGISPREYQNKLLAASVDDPPMR